MTFRERCACGAEFEVGDVPMPGKGNNIEPLALSEWRERHEKVCPGFVKVSAPYGITCSCGTSAICRLHGSPVPYSTTAYVSAGSQT